MTVTSQILPVKLALVALITAALEDEKVQVTFGNAGKDMKRETVYVGRVRARQGADKFGNVRRKEMLDAQVICNVAKPGTQEDITGRVCQIAGLIEAALREVPSSDLGLGPVKLAELTHIDVNEGFTDGGREAEAELTITVTSRLPRG